MPILIKKILTSTLIISGIILWLGALLGYAYFNIATDWAEDCPFEIVESFESPNNKRQAKIILKSCGGITTDFFGTINVVNRETNTSQNNVFSFNSKPADIGLNVSWIQDNKLILTVEKPDDLRMQFKEPLQKPKLTINYHFE